MSTRCPESSGRPPWAQGYAVWITLSGREAEPVRPHDWGWSCFGDLAAEALQRDGVHAVVGELELTGEALELPGDAGLTIITYTVEPNTDSEQALSSLASWSTQESTANPNA